jgi:hypothetical protein
MGTVVIKLRLPGDLDSYFPPSQKAASAVNVDDVTGSDGNAARTQFQNLASRLVLYRNHPDLRPACRANKDIQADVCNYA